MYAFSGDENMRVMLVNPKPAGYTRARCAPLGVLSIASYLEANGHEVKVLNRAIKSTDINVELDEFKPDYIGCSLLTNLLVKDCIEVSQAAKKRGVTVVWGGPYISAIPEIVLQLDCIDLLSLGEGEETWLELLDTAEKGGDIYSIKGLAYMKDGRFVKTPEREFIDLSKLVPINYDLIDTRVTLYKNYDYDGIMGMYLSKGCTGRCTFCYNHNFQKSCRRSRPIEHFIQEAKYVKEKFGAKAIAMADELFGCDKETLREFCDAMNEANLGLHWGAMTKIGIFDREDFRMMYDAGCRWLEFGVESGAQSTLARMKKGMKLSRVEEDLQICREIGIITLCYFIVGFPDETEEELLETCRLINKIDYSRFVCSYFSPLPGSEIFDKLVAEGRHTPPKTMKESMKTKILYSPKPNLSKVRTLELKVVRSHMLWRSFTKKKFDKNGKDNYATAKKDIYDVLKSLKGHGFKAGVEQFFISGYEFLDIFFYANFFPSILKKYELKK